MKPLRLCLALVLGALASLASAQAASDSGRVYELRTYTTAPDKLDALLARFRDHTLKIFERHGMENVGYWVPMEAKDGASNKLVYLLAHKNRDAAKASWKAFSADPQWQEVKKKTEANGKIVEKVDSVYLTPTDYSKAMNAGNGKGAARVFELRTYTAPEGKLGALDARFRDHTIKLFAKHGITNLGYFHPADADKGAANTLIYFLAYPSREAAAASFKAFRDDPDWQKALNNSQKDGKLTAKSPDSLFLKPVDFSKIK
jgi:hypothetical protein